MSWIEELDWDGELSQWKAKVSDPETGQVDNIMAVHSLDASSLRAHFNLYVQAMRPTNSLPKVDREMIAIVVSKLNGCEY